MSCNTQCLHVGGYLLVCLYFIFGTLVSPKPQISVSWSLCMITSYSPCRFLYAPLSLSFVLSPLPVYHIIGKAKTAMQQTTTADTRWARQCLCLVAPITSNSHSACQGWLLP